MDDKLKEAIQTVRNGNTLEAQRQLAELLEDDPQQEQGWYLLSLLVDSPQKQATYLSKTLALNPQHEKAREHLATLQETGSLAATATIADEAGEALSIVDQAESDDLPDWLSTEGEPDLVLADKFEQAEEAAVANETLPDWLKEPAALDADLPEITEEMPTAVGQTAEQTAEADKTVVKSKQTLAKAIQKPAKAARATSSSTRALNIALSVLVILAIVVMVLLAYLLLS